MKRPKFSTPTPDQVREKQQREWDARCKELAATRRPTLSERLAAWLEKKRAQ